MFGTYEKDYIMRLVKQAVRMLLKLLFGIDTMVPMEEVMEQAEEKVITERLIDMADRGLINEAENELCEITADGDRRYLKTALLFYYHLANMSDNFLTANNYSQQEIKEGVEALMERYNLTEMSDFIFD